MNKETKLQNEIRLGLGELDMRTFRANIGLAYVGSKYITLSNGDLLIKNPRRFSSGLPAGFSDLFGIKTITITQDMVGKKIGQFCAIEVKTKTGRLSEKQQNFIDMVLFMGGVAGVARSVDDALKLLARP